MRLIVGSIGGPSVEFGFVVTFRGMETGRVTRSRSNALNVDAIEKESVNSSPGTPTKKSGENKSDDDLPAVDVKMSSDLDKINNEEVAASPVRTTRNRRSISLTLVAPDSPSRNLRKRAATPELTKNTPKKTQSTKDDMNLDKYLTVDMTPTKRLLKQFEGSLVTVDSPKPRKSRLSIESTDAKPEATGLRRSRRLSTELNVVEEDPILEAVIESTPVESAKTLPKTRRGKRLSVAPSQPSVPEEIETNDDKVIQNDYSDDKFEMEVKTGNNSVKSELEISNNSLSFTKKSTPIVVIEDCQKENSMINIEINCKNASVSENVEKLKEIEGTSNDEVMNDSVSGNLQKSVKSENSSDDIADDESPKSVVGRRSLRILNKDKSSDESNQGSNNSPNRFLEQSPMCIENTSIGSRSSLRRANKSLDCSKTMDTKNNSGIMENSFPKTPNNSQVDISAKEDTPKNRSNRRNSKRISSINENEVLENMQVSINSDSPSLKIVTDSENSDRSYSSRRSNRRKLSNEMAVQLENLHISKMSESGNISGKIENELDADNKINTSDKMNTSCKSLHSEKSADDSSNTSLTKVKRVTAAELFLKENSSAEPKDDKLDKSLNDSVISKNGKKEIVKVISSTPLANPKPKKNKSNSSIKNTSQNSATSKKSIAINDSDDSSDEDNTFLDQAEEAGSDYQSGDSMEESERREIEENEIIPRGETLNTTDSSAMESDDSYEKDSFVCSTDEEDNELLSGTGDDLSSGEELSQSAESKRKFNEKARKLQKKASREMYEARHGIKNKSKSFNNSGKNDFSALESDNSNMDHNEENEITNMENSNLNSASKDQLSLTTNNADKDSSNSQDCKMQFSDDESEDFHKIYEEELKKLRDIEVSNSDDDSTESEDVKDSSNVKNNKRLSNEGNKSLLDEQENIGSNLNSFRKSNVCENGSKRNSLSKSEEESNSKRESLSKSSKNESFDNIDSKNSQNKNNGLIASDDKSAQNETSRKSVSEEDITENEKKSRKSSISKSKDKSFEREDLKNTDNKNNKLKSMDDQSVKVSTSRESISEEVAAKNENKTRKSSISKSKDKSFNQEDLKNTNSKNNSFKSMDDKSVKAATSRESIGEEAATVNENKKRKSSISKPPNDTPLESTEKLNLENEDGLKSTEDNASDVAISQKTSDGASTKSTDKKKKCPSKFNLSDVANNKKEKSAKNTNKSLNLESDLNFDNDSSKRALTLQESMNRLRQMDESMSKIFSSILNTADQVKYMQINSSDNAISPSVQQNDTDVSAKRKHERDVDEVEENPLKKTCIAEKKQTAVKSASGSKISKKQSEQSSDLKKISQKSKTIKKSRDSGASLTIKTEQKLRRAIATTDFDVEDLGVKKTSWTNTAGDFVVTHINKEKNIPCDSTTVFKVVSMKKRPKQEIRVEKTQISDFFNFKNNALFTNNKREQSSNLKKYQQKRLQNKINF